MKKSLLTLFVFLIITQFAWAQILINKNNASQFNDENIYYIEDQGSEKHVAIKYNTVPSEDFELENSYDSYTLFVKKDDFGMIDKIEPKDLLIVEEGDYYKLEFSKDEFNEKIKITFYKQQEQAQQGKTKKAKKTKNEITIKAKNEITIKAKKTKNEITIKVATENNTPESIKKLNIAPGMGYNFTGKENDNTNTVQPLMFLGWDVDKIVDGGKMDNFVHDISFQAGPLVTLDLNLSDSVNVLSSLMLPGNFNIIANFHYSLLRKKIEGGKDVYSHRIFFPVGFGIKTITGLKNDVGTLSQVYMKTGIGYSYKDWISFEGIVSIGTNDFISPHGNNFKEYFSESHHDDGVYSVSNGKIATVGVNASFKIPSKNNDPNLDEALGYLFVKWRQVINKENYHGGEFPMIMTIGFTKPISTKKTYKNPENSILEDGDSTEVEYSVPVFDSKTVNSIY